MICRKGRKKLEAARDNILIKKGNRTKQPVYLPPFSHSLGRDSDSESNDVDDFLAYMTEEKKELKIALLSPCDTKLKAHWSRHSCWGNLHLI